MIRQLFVSAAALLLFFNFFALALCDVPRKPGALEFPSLCAVHNSWSWTVVSVAVWVGLLCAMGFMRGLVAVWRGLQAELRATRKP